MTKSMECKLSDIATIIDCEHKTAPTVESSEYLSIRTSDIFNGKINYDAAYRVSEETYYKWTNRAIPQTNDIILAREAPVGEVGIIRKGFNVCLGQRTVLIKVDSKKVYNLYLLYYLCTPLIKYDLQSRSTGSVVLHLNVKDIRNFDLSLPPLPEQKAIASVLSSLDDKIDLLHRQNKTLEAMAETLFRQWFVEEAEEDWVEGRLGDIAVINPAYQIKKGVISTYLEMKNVSVSTFNPEDWDKREFTSGMKFQNGDTLLARITPCLENGKTCFVTFLDDEETGWGSTEYIVLKMKEPFHPFISYIIAKDRDFRDFTIGSMSGSSGRQRVQANVIKEYTINIPAIKIVKELNIQLDGILSKLKKNAYQIPILEKLRDTLLPKLMSGEVRLTGEEPI